MNAPGLLIGYRDIDDPGLRHSGAIRRRPRDHIPRRIRIIIDDEEEPINGYNAAN
jgi:hypothetical protein